MNVPRVPKPRIPLTVLTGFLGAGKTSLLNALLKDPALAGTAVIVNEFGEIGIDNLLVAEAEDGIVELSAGCLCCTIRGELVTSLEDLLRALDNHRIERLARVVVETTGLADPVPVLQSVLLHPYLSLRYRLDGVVTVVDAVNGEEALARHFEAARQVAVADRIVLSKTDLVDEAPVRAAIRRLNPSAPILDAAKGEATVERLLDSQPFVTSGKIPDVETWLAADDDHGHAPGHHHHDGHEGHDHGRPGQDPHDVSRHDARIRTFAAIRTAPIGRAALDDFLARLAAEYGPHLLRLKGLVGTTDSPDRPLVIQAARTVFHPPARLDAWPGTDRRSRLVFIVDDLDAVAEAAIKARFSDLPQIDMADAASIASNPLAVPGFQVRF